MDHERGPALPFSDLPISLDRSGCFITLTRCRFLVIAIEVSTGPNLLLINCRSRERGVTVLVPVWENIAGRRLVQYRSIPELTLGHSASRIEKNFTPPPLRPQPPEFFFSISSLLAFFSRLQILESLEITVNSHSRIQHFYPPAIQRLSYRSGFIDISQTNKKPSSNKKFGNCVAKNSWTNDHVCVLPTSNKKYFLKKMAIAGMLRCTALKRIKPQRAVK